MTRGWRRYGSALIWAALGVQVGCQSGADIRSAVESRGERLVRLDGEIVDLHCYFLDPARNRGMGHAQCANECIRKGLPAGFVADGHVYMLLPQEHRAINGDVFRMCGNTVEVVGMVVREGGMDAIWVKSIAGMAIAPFRAAVD